MLMVVNKELYVKSYNIINFINFDISGMINSIANLRSSKEYLYFFYVKEDVVFNWYSICNSFIDDQICQKNIKNSFIMDVLPSNQNIK